MKVGERYRVRPIFTTEAVNGGKPTTGTVVYVHPKGRFAVLEFIGRHGKCCETFRPEALTADNRITEEKRRRRNYG